jgi:hypothetical protein
MASNFFLRHLVITLIVITCVVSTYTPALAASSREETPSEVHIIKFFLDPALVPDMNVAKVVLAKYVADMNVALAKNTNRSIVFDPETGIILTTTKPQTDSAWPPLPTENFEIWVYAVPSTIQTSYGGYAGVDISGAGVLAGFHWVRLYNPDKLTAGQVNDYSLQLNNLLHEFAHVFYAGIGEYYNLTDVTDTTGFAPFLNINIDDPADPFWSNKRDFLVDPLLKVIPAASRTEYLGKARFSSLTAAIINGPYRNGIQSFTQFTVQMLDSSGQPMEAANVKVWNLVGLFPNSSQLVFDGMTDATGQVIVDWGGNQPSHNASNFLRLIKIYKDGVSVAQPKYISIFDMDKSLLVSQSASFVVTFNEDMAGIEKEQTILSTGAYDGYILESGETTNKGGTMKAQSPTLFVGDDNLNRQYLSILSFDTSTLPDDAIITSVELKMKYAGKAGTLPFSTLRGLYADIQGTYFGSLVNLQITDFRASAAGILAAKFTSTPTNGWYSAELDPSSFAYFDLTDTTQFRLHFKLDDNNNKSADYLKFHSGTASNQNNRPQLIIHFILP